MTKYNLAILTLALMAVACNTQMRNQAEQNQSEQYVGFENFDFYGDSTYISQAMQFDKVDVKPEIIEKALPGYPDAARRAGRQGIVVLRTVIDEQGKVIFAGIAKPVLGLNDVSLEAIIKSTFKPAIHKGKPVKVIWDIPYDFKLF